MVYRNIFIAAGVSSGQEKYPKASWIPYPLICRALSVAISKEMTHVRVVVSQDLRAGNCAVWANNLQIALHPDGFSCTAGLTEDQNLSVFTHRRNRHEVKLLDQPAIHTIAAHLFDGIRAKL